MEEFLLNAVSNVGVPAVLAFYVLFRVNLTMEKLTEAIIKLDAKLDTHIARVPKAH